MADGYIVYQGPANKAPQYFAKLGYQSGKFSNPADVFMKVLSLNYPMQTEDHQKIELLVENYKKYQEAEVEAENNQSVIGALEISKKTKTIAPFSVQY